MALYVVPNVGQSLNSSLLPIQSNFNTIQTAFIQDHVDYAAPTQGMHQRITIPLWTGAPTAFPATNGTQVALYCANDINHNPALFFQPPGANGVNPGINFTSAGYTQGTVPPYGFVRTPSNIAFVWGQGSTNAGTHTVNIDLSGYFDTDIYNVQLTLLYAGGGINPQILAVQAINPNRSFDVYGQPNGGAQVALFYFLATGF